LIDELGTLDAIGMATAIQRGDLQPLEVIESIIHRIESVNPKINALTTLTYDLALERAKKPVKGPFCGVPFALKDVTDYSGVRLTFGSRWTAKHVSDWTPPFVNALEATGLIVVGKTNTPEFGLLATTESEALGACHNPWDLSCSVGGSSGGAAALVAAGLLPMAQGTDGGGSIRIPASCCGVFGLKPSRGRMLRFAKNQMPGDIGVPHTLSRSVRDCALVHALTEDQSSNAKYAPTGHVRNFSHRRLKIAFAPRNYFGDEPDDDVREAIMSTATLCSDLGHHIDIVDIPIHGETFLEHFMTAWALGPSTYASMIEGQLGAEGKGSDLLEPWTWGLADFFNAKPPGAMDRALVYFARVEREMSAWMTSYDVLLTPALKSSPPRIGEQGPKVPFEELFERVTNYGSYTALHNATGMPAMSVPLFWNDDGLPIGSQFVAPHGDEGLLLSLAYELEDARPWFDMRAPFA
jgi:amidase